MAGDPKTEWSKSDYYKGAEAGDFSGVDEPFRLFEEWLGEARKHEVNDPNAMALATVDPTGMPNVRVVLLKGLDERLRHETGMPIQLNSHMPMPGMPAFFKALSITKLVLVPMRVQVPPKIEA